MLRVLITCESYCVIFIIFFFNKILKMHSRVNILVLLLLSL